MSDLIRQLASGAASLEEAEALLEVEIEKWRNGEVANWADLVGMSADEQTAYLHGATLDVLARFRLQGWPTECCRCGAALHLAAEHWLYMLNQHVEPVLVHLECPLPRLAENSCDYPSERPD